ncbi:MAG: ribosome hibernation-promoting factor, HPF/YfiA family [Planctomycetota bacterium]|jgi:putative sigma-54 modulation protein
MKINITGRHFDVSDAIREYIDEKVKRLDRTFDGVSELDVLLKADDRSLHCEFILHIKNKPSIVIDVADESIYAAIDLATDKAQRQLRRHKERTKEHRKSEAPTEV